MLSRSEASLDHLCSERAFAPAAASAQDDKYKERIDTYLDEKSGEVCDWSASLVKPLVDPVETGMFAAGARPPGNPTPRYA